MELTLSTVTSADAANGYAADSGWQIAVEVLKRQPNNPDDGIEFVITVLNPSGAAIQCNNISFLAFVLRGMRRRASG